MAELVDAADSKFAKHNAYSSSTLDGGTFLFNNNNYLIMEKKIKTTNFESVKSEETKTFESVAQGLENLVELFYEHKLEETRTELDICRKIQTKYCKKLAKAKWYNKWFYKLMLDRAIKNFLICAGGVYFLEHDFKDSLTTLKDKK